MKTITTPNPTLKEFIEQMRLLCIQQKRNVNIQWKRETSPFGVKEEAIASFYVKGELVDTRAFG